MDKVTAWLAVITISFVLSVVSFGTLLYFGFATDKQAATGVLIGTIGFPMHIKLFGLPGSKKKII